MERPAGRRFRRVDVWVLGTDLRPFVVLRLAPAEEPQAGSVGLLRPTGCEPTSVRVGQFGLTLDPLVALACNQLYFELHHRLPPGALLGS